jgi:hypothetical protein
MLGRAPVARSRRATEFSTDPATGAAYAGARAPRVASTTANFSGRRCPSTATLCRRTSETPTRGLRGAPLVEGGSTILGHGFTLHRT